MVEGRDWHAAEGDAVLAALASRPTGLTPEEARARLREHGPNRLPESAGPSALQLLVGQLAPEEEEVVLGTAEVRATFRVPRTGTVAGCYVVEGVVQRGAKARLLRDGVVIHDGTIGSLKRFKDDVREVQSGFECGIGFENYDDIKDGDLIEVYAVREVART